MCPSHPPPMEPSMRHALAFLALSALPSLAAPAAVHAQRAASAASRAAMPSRAVMLEDVERSRGNVLKYLDAAPDSALGYRPLAGVRTLAEQIEHAAGGNVFILSSAWKVRPPAAAAADTAARRRDKALMRAFVNQSYDTFAQFVRNATPAQLSAERAFAGSTKAGWRWVATALEHTTWTLGQTVPYLRAHGVTPPQYLPF